MQFCYGKIAMTSIPYHIYCYFYETYCCCLPFRRSKRVQYGHRDCRWLVGQSIRTQCHNMVFQEPVILLSLCHFVCKRIRILCDSVYFSRKLFRSHSFPLRQSNIFRQQNWNENIQNIEDKLWTVNGLSNLFSRSTHRLDELGNTCVLIKNVALRLPTERTLWVSYE